jgi:hypothetical protein
MSYYMRATHWLDAMTPPLERHLDELVDTVTSFLSVSEGDQPPVAEAIVVPPQEKRSPMPTWAYALIGLIMVTIMVGLALWIVPRLDSTDSSSSATLVSSDTEPTGTSNSDQIQPSESTSNLEWSEWRELSFNVPNEVLWSQSEDGSYTAHAQESDSFAWSDEIVEGDFILSLEITTLDDSFLGYIVVYGDGGEFSPGNLIFQIESVFAIVKDTIYVGGDVWLAEIPSNMKFQPGQTYNVTIEVIDDLASLYLDDTKVTSARIDNQVKRIGKVALLKYWDQDEVTFSNIQIKTRPRGD